jgi:chromosome partitioning protein
MNPVGKLTGNLLTPLAGVRDGRFLDAAMAASALVANADGAVSRAERGVLEKVFSTVEELKAFDIDLAVNSFNAFAHGICSQGEPGRARAIRAVSEMSGDAEGARLVIRIGCAVARTNDDFSPAERERIGLIAAAAGIAVPEICGKPLEYGNTWGRQPHVITLASAKGGTGKSTTALHLVVGLLKLGHRVGSIDLDGRQGTMSRYLTNRASWTVETGQELAMPRHRRIEASRQANRDLVEQEEQAGFTKALGDMTGCTYVVIDTPGNDSHIARLGYVQADTLITPLNDSFLDIDILARIDRRKREVLGPSEYCKLIWQENDRRVASDRPPIDWIVMRNRLAHVDTRNNREILSLLRQLAQRIGFRLEHGLSERVVFRELFLKGLTLLDLPEDEAEGRDQASHMNARREIDDLLQAVGALG